MINIFITLGLLLLIQLYIVLYISDKITINKERDNYYNLNLFKKFMEILVIIVVILYTCKIYLKNNLSENIITQIIIVIEIIVTLFWLYLNFIEPNIIDYDSNNNYVNAVPTATVNAVPLATVNAVPTATVNAVPTATVNSPYKDLNDHTSILINNINNDNTYIANNNTIVKDNSDDSRIFSKYISKYESDFEFDYLYPNYKAKKTECKKKTPDLSEYDGYASNHKCYNCGCVKQNNSDKKECKKLMYGTMWGCDPKWKCNNCNDCQEDEDDEDEDDEEDDEDEDEDEEEGGEEGGEEEDDEEEDEENKKLPGCRGCKCYNRNGTLKCQRTSPITKELIECDSVCETCTRCPNDEDNTNCSNSIFKVVQPENEINRNNIVINNVSEKDLNTIL
jgi:hypothetical protein